MSTATSRTVSAPRWTLWTGWPLSFGVVAQLLSSAWFRATHHTYAAAQIVTGYDYPESAIVPIVIAECALVVLYLVPQTSVLAAIVMTGYLGGAAATHLRIADTARAAIPLVVGILAWGGLYLRDSRIPPDGRWLVLLARRTKRFRITTDSDQPIAENALDRKFEASQPNRVWSTDITYVWRLALPGDHHRPVLATSGRLGDGQSHADLPRAH